MDGFLRGDFLSLPPVESNLVRIFTSSTFTDMWVERNYLMQNVYPKLRQYCQQLGLEFEVVDMRWGVNDDMSADHMTTKLCLREITTCQRLSRGPNFVALLGEKYGFRPLPNEVKKEEFELLLDIIKEDKEFSQSSSLLQKWFWEDTNSEPPVYILQPITAHFRHYNDMSDVNAREADRNNWWNDFSNLRKILTVATNEATRKGAFEDAEKEKYLISVTESEVQRGIIRAKSPNTDSLCFVRVFVGLENEVVLDDIKPFVDVDDHGKRDEDSIKRADFLRFKKLRKALSSANLNCYQVSWKTGGINHSVDEHQKYLQELGDCYLEQVKQLVSNRLNDNCVIESEATLSYRKEALNHAWFCVSKCKTFSGREEELVAVKTALSSNIRVVVLHGRSGCGKTALMAKISEQMRGWSGGRLNVVLRFLGTTPDSSNVHSLLKSLVLQICSIYHTKHSSLKSLDNFNVLLQEFSGILGKVSELQDEPLAIVLDSLDQLSSLNSAFSLQWLPRNIPSNVFLVLSTIADYSDLLTTIKNRYGTSSCYVEVLPLGLETADAVMENYFQLVKRSVTDLQRELLKRRLQGAVEPLLLKLLFDEACNWKSYEEVPESRLAESISGAISLLFERTERKFGQTLISHAVGYIAASKSGLSEMEIEDILSLDNEVLDHVYEYWDPPLKGVIRLPPLLWKRVKYEMEEYLTERQADGVTVLNWYHRQFSEESRRRYIDRQENGQQRYQLIAEYFLGTFSNGITKAITLSKRGKTLLHLDRQVASQPLVFGEGHYNLRKLNELPNALLKGKDFSTLYEHVLFNYKWLLMKITATSVHETLSDFESTLNEREDEELKQLYDCLILSSSNLQQEPESLASQLLGRLSFVFLSDAFPNTRHLLKQAKVWCRCQLRPVLMPKRTCMTTPGGFLLTTFKNHIGRVLSVAFLKSSKEFLSLARNAGNVVVTLWDVETIAQKVSFSLSSKDDPFMSSSRNSHSLYIACSQELVKISLRKEEIRHRTEWPVAIVTALQLSSCGKLLGVGFKGGNLRVYASSDLSLSSENCISESGITTLLWGQQESILYVGSGEGIVHGLDITENSLSRSERLSQSPITTMVLDNSVLVATSTAGEVIWLDRLSLKVIDQYSFSIPIRCSCFVKDLLFCGSDDGFVRMWRTNQSTPLKSLKAHDKEVWCLALVSQRYDMIVSGSKDDTLCIIDVERFDIRQRLVGHSSWISCAGVTNDGQFILSGSNDKNVKLWKWDETASESQNITQELFPHEKHPTSIRVPKDQLIAISGSPDVCNIWNLQSGALVKAVKTSVRCMEVAKNQNKFFVASSNGNVEIYTIPQFEGKLLYKGKGAGVSCLRLAEDDSFLVAGFNDGSLGLFYVKDGSKYYITKAHDSVTCIELWSKSLEPTLASGGKDKVVKIWQINAVNENESNVEAFVCRHTIVGDTGIILCLIFHMKGEYVITGSRNGLVRCIQVSSGQVIKSFQASSTQDSVMCILPLGQGLTLAIHGPKENLLLWYPSNEETVRHFHGHTHAVMCLVLTEDTKYLFSGSRDGTLKVWDTEDGCLLDSVDFQSQVKCVEISSFIDGRYLVAATAMSGSIILADFYPNETNRQDTTRFSKAQSDRRIQTKRNLYVVNPRIQSTRFSRCCEIS